MSADGHYLKGKHVIVTGGGRGIGAAISKALKAAGYKVAATYAGNDEAAQKFKAETGINVYKWDVSSFDACAAGIKQVEADEDRAGQVEADRRHPAAAVTGQAGQPHPHDGHHHADEGHRHAGELDELDEGVDRPAHG